MARANSPSFRGLEPRAILARVGNERGERPGLPLSSAQLKRRIPIMKTFALLTLALSATIAHGNQWVDVGMAQYVGAGYRGEVVEFAPIVATDLRLRLPNQCAITINPLTV